MKFYIRKMADTSNKMIDVKVPIFDDNINPMSDS